MGVPQLRIRPCNDSSIRGDRDYVLYWMIGARRTRFNYGLQYAVEQAVELRRPLLVLEALRCGYRYASDRIHRFVLDGMRDNREAFAEAPVTYYPFVEPKADAGKGLLKTLARHACHVVTDDYPAFEIPRFIAAASGQIDCRLTAVDTNGIYPMHATDRVFTMAHSFRRHLQKSLPPFLEEAPEEDPLSALPSDGPRADVPADIAKRWPSASEEILAGEPSALAQLPIDHAVLPTDTVGGPKAGAAALELFLDRKFGRYVEDRNQPEAEVQSFLSPYLHFGHVSSHDVFAEVVRREDWSIVNLAPKASGSREGWWGMSPPAEAFLDQIVTWREIGFNMCSHRDDADQYESLPDWAQATLADHEADPRPHAYDKQALDDAETHDPLWNAAQNQLRREGRIHNYLRMLWGKKILEWSRTPRGALDALLELNDRYALDGRDPNSLSGIFWTLGRYDRAWGPERPIFGKIRYMSSENTARKVRVRDYVARYA